jgi:hypothetical protein
MVIVMSERKNAARRAARGYPGPKGKPIQIPTAEIKNRIDVLISPAASPHAVLGGWIEMSANAKGREAIQRIFPGANFLWRKCPFAEWLGDDWQAIAPHIPSAAAHCATTLPQYLTKLKPLQECTDAALTFLMAVAITEQGGRVAYLTDTGRKFKEGHDLFGDSISGNGMRFNLYESSLRAPPNVLNLPTVRPINDNDPREKFLGKMAEMANNNVALYDGTSGPIKKILSEAEVVFGIWNDLTQRLGFGYFVIKGAEILERCVRENETMPARCSAIACTDAEQAVATKHMWETTWSKEAA